MTERSFRPREQDTNLPEKREEESLISMSQISPTLTSQEEDLEFFSRNSERLAVTLRETLHILIEKRNELRQALETGQLEIFFDISSEVRKTLEHTWEKIEEYRTQIQIDYPVTSSWNKVIASIAKLFGVMKDPLFESIMIARPARNEAHNQALEQIKNSLNKQQEELNAMDSQFDTLIAFKAQKILQDKNPQEYKVLQNIFKNRDIAERNLQLIRPDTGGNILNTLRINYGIRDSTTAVVITALRSAIQEDIERLNRLIDNILRPEIQEIKNILKNRK